MAVPLRVLILEDVPADAERLVYELGRAGFDLDWQRIETESDYLAHLDPTPDIILADYHVPSFDALRALRILQERGLDTPFIVITGTVGDEAAAECIKQGATDYLLKDRLARLGQAVAQALEQARLRDKKRQVEHRLRLQDAAVKSAANAIVITDREGRITSVNPAFTRLTGYTAQEAVGESPRLLRSGKHDQTFYRNLWETILAGKVWSGEVINRRKDGSLYTEEQTITPVRDERGAISHFIAIKQDVTQRKRAEEALREIHDTLEAVIQASPMGITILDSGGNVKLWNPAAERIFGWRQEEVLGRPLPTIPPDKREEHRSFLERVLRGEACSGVEIARQKQDGSLIDISLSTAPLRDAKGGIWGAMGIMADISERKRFESQLEAVVEERTRQLQEATRKAEEASRHKSEFLANMSHELRTPLNSILGFSELLAQHTYGPLTEKQARYVVNIHSSGEHLLALINDLLDLSKVEAGKLELHPQSFHLREAIEAALHLFRHQVEAKQQALMLQVADDLSAITADPLRVRQILYNLLSNAVKFTPPGGAITVTARRVPSSEFHVPSSEPGTWDLEPGTGRVTEFVEIAVADTGIGIKPEDLPKLFQPFTQLENTLTKQTQGAGLGLALTKHLVELHGGTIWAESAGNGRGSTFRVWLPLTGPRGTPRVFVVDDDETLLATLRDALEAAGYQVATMRDGATALAQIATARPDLVILDLRLPAVDGWAVLRQLRADSDTRALPVLTITGVDVDRGDDVLTAGADEFLTKPFSLTVLESTVRRLLEAGALAGRLSEPWATA